MKIALNLLLSIFLISTVAAQEEENGKKSWRIGLNYGAASQERFPFNDKDYFYDQKYVKFQLNYTWKKKKRFTYEINIEPSIYFSEHQLLNASFIAPEPGTDYEERRALFTQRRSLREYALNAGLIVRYAITNNFSTYMLGSSGPMILADETERLKKGFAFSNVFGYGFAYSYKSVVFDLRGTLRHSSNANIQQPNSGHDSVGLETGITIRI